MAYHLFPISFSGSLNGHFFFNFIIECFPEKNYICNMIDRSTIDRIMEAANIVDVVSEFVTLRKAGVNYKGLCPFHNEKTPSFVVSPSKGLCKCFSCGKGGNVVHFIMEHEQMTYPEALRWLAQKYHIEIKEKDLTQEELQVQNERESLFILNEWARNYFQDILFNHADGKSIGMSYFRSRGFRDDIIKKFQLGFSLPQRDALATEALSKGYKANYLVKTGLCYIRDNGKLADRYHGRVIFPIHTLSGKVVAFGGRVLQTGDKIAKYVNSPESEIYHKSLELYGIYFAKQAIVRNDCCYLVEGYTDVISMHQSGIENVVASSGTSLTPGQIRLIHRFTSNITILYDGDMAGIKASIRGIDMLLEEGMNVKVLLLPDGDDPDSFARKHSADEYKRYIEDHQVDFIQFKTNLLLKECENDPIKRAQLISSIVKSISAIPDAIVRSVYIKECSTLMQINETILLEEVTKNRREERNKQKKGEKTESTNEKQSINGKELENGNRSASLTDTTGTLYPKTTAHRCEQREKLIIELIIKYGEMPLGIFTDDSGTEKTFSVAEYIHEDLQNDDLKLQNPLYNQILEEVLAHQNEPGFKASLYFQYHPQPAINQLAIELINEPYQLSKYHGKNQKIETESERLPELVPHVLIDLKYAIVQEELDTILDQLRSSNASNSATTRIVELMQRYKELKNIEAKLAQQLGERVVII